MDPVIIKLSRPLATKDGRTLETLTMREPLVRDMRAAKKASTSEDGQEVTLFANLCEITPSDIDQLPVSDYRKVQEAFSAFNGSAET